MQALFKILIGKQGMILGTEEPFRHLQEQSKFLCANHHPGFAQIKPY